MSQQGATAEPHPSLELAHYGRVLRRRAWVVALGALLGLLLAFAYLAVADRTVTATSTVNVNVISSDPFNPTRAPADLIDAETETQVATSSAVLQAAAAILDGTTPSEIESATEVSLASDATIMRLSYTADSTEEAEAGANAMAESYLDFRSQQASGRVDSIVDQLNVRRDDLRQDLVRINTIAQAAGPTSSRAIQAESDRQLVNIELDSLSTQINSFLGLDTTGGTVLSQASENPTTVAPSRLQVLVVGTLGGLLLGVVMAFVVAGLDRRVRDEYDVRRLGGGEVMGELTGTRAAIPATTSDMDALRAVRERLLATMPDSPPTVAVADLTVSGRAPDVAVNLAETFAESGHEVEIVLADADDETAAVLTSALGLSQQAPHGDPPRHVRESDGLSLVLPRRGILPVPHRPHPGGPTQDSRVTVIAVPRGAPSSVLLSAGRMGHSVVLVVGRSGTKRATVERVSRELAVVGATIHGTIFTPRRRRFARRRASK